MNKTKISSYSFFKKLTTFPFVEQIILYGSRARNDNTELSDIDLAINCPRATDKNWAEILEIIEEADTLLKIDCIRLDTLSNTNRLKQSIAKDGIILYSKENK